MHVPAIGHFRAFILNGMTSQRSHLPFSPRFGELRDLLAVPVRSHYSFGARPLIFIASCFLYVNVIRIRRKEYHTADNSRTNTSVSRLPMKNDERRYRRLLFNIFTRSVGYFSYSSKRSWLCIAIDLAVIVAKRELWTISVYNVDECFHIIDTKIFIAVPLQTQQNCKILKYLSAL